MLRNLAIPAVLILCLGLVALWTRQAPTASAADAPAAEASVLQEPGGDASRRRRARAESRLAVHRDEHGRIPHDAILRARGQMDALMTEGTAAGLDSTKWQAPGPGNFGGRTRALVIHPTRHRTMFCGSVSGGIWRTDDGGGSWRQVNDLLENLAITTMVLDPRDPNVMYAGTGEANASWGNIRGAGIFKSTDGGRTWARLASTNNASFYFVSRIAISPDGRTLLAATGGSRIWRSTDAGATWRATYRGRGTGHCKDVDFHPTASNRVVAYVSDEDANQTSFSDAVYSTDGGQTWTRAGGIGTAGAQAADNRIELTWHAGNLAGAGMVYALEYDQSQTNQSRILRSTNGGMSFTLVSTSAQILQMQGDYDNALWVDPSDNDTDPTNDVLVAGGIDLWRSVDGGATFVQISQDTPASAGSAHNDHHVIVEHPAFDGDNNTTVFFGTDGGIYRTDDVYAVQRLRGWVKLDNGLAITQFYGASRHESGILYGGTQDNGTLSQQPNQGPNGWIEAVGGDGGFTASDPTDRRYHYGEAETARVHRSVDGGRTGRDIDQTLTDAGSENTAPFIAPLVLDPNDPRHLYVGTLRLWRTTDARATNVAWAVRKAALGGGEMVTAIEVARGNPNLVFVGYDSGAIDYSTNARANTPTWTARDQGLPARYCTRIRIDPRNTRRVFATFGGFRADNIWESNDGGATWTARSTAPLAAPVRDIAFHPTNPRWLYAATESGLIVSENGGQTWTATATPARCAVDGLFWSAGHLYLVTHGRGIFHQSPNAATTRARGQPCRLNGPVRGPTLAATPPVIGTTVTLTVTGAVTPANGALFLSAVPAAPFQVSPGCFIQLALVPAPLNAAAIPIANGRGTARLPIPRNAWFVGQSLMTQAVVVSGAGLDFSNGVVLGLGY